MTRSADREGLVAGAPAGLPGLAARIALRVLRSYKLLISPLFSGSCRYLPSCADYTAEAIERHGAAAGTVLGVRRLCRCHPFGGSGHDPVPVGNPWRRVSVGRDRPEGARSARRFGNSAGSITRSRG